jgi:hypothetical protein
MAIKYNKPRVLANGMLAYPKRGWEPPPLIEGYKRKSDNPRSSDAWILIPIWSTCIFRKQVQVRKEGCHCITMYHVCINENVGKEPVVNLNLCSLCKFCKTNA